MNISEYARYDGLGLAEVIRFGDVTSTEVAELFIQAVAKVNPQINSVIEVYEDALEIAAQSNLQAPFGGVPFLRKDLGAIEAGRLQELGSRLFKGYRPDHDSYLTTRFKKAGLAIMGRSTVPELGISGQTETILQGITRNPWNLERMAGGSIRIPASCCGLVGLNPSRGRIRAGPDRQDPMFGLAREFIVSRSVRDTAAMLDAVHGVQVGDPFIRAGTPGGNYSGDIFLAFSTANDYDLPNMHNLQPVDFTLDYINDHYFDDIYRAAVQAVEEAVVNAMIAAESMTTVKPAGYTLKAIDHNRLRRIMQRYNRLNE